MKFLKEKGLAMTIALITEPLVEPIGLAELKAHLRIDHAHEDQVILDTAKAARQYVEYSSGQKLISQTWRQYEICLPAERKVQLRISPVQSISAVTAFDSEGSPQVLASEDTELVRGSDPAVVEFANSLVGGIAANGLEIDLTVGFGDLGLDVPDILKRAILLLTAHWFEFRGAVSPENQPVSLPAGFDSLMRSYRRINL